jgi:hypothetical protein
MAGLDWATLGWVGLLLYQSDTHCHGVNTSAFARPLGSKYKKNKPFHGDTYDPQKFKSHGHGNYAMLR